MVLCSIERPVGPVCRSRSPQRSRSSAAQVRWATDRRAHALIKANATHSNIVSHTSPSCSFAGEPKAISCFGVGFSGWVMLIIATLLCLGLTTLLIATVICVCCRRRQQKSGEGAAMHAYCTLWGWLTVCASLQQTGSVLRVYACMLEELTDTFEAVLWHSRNQSTVCMD